MENAYELEPILNPLLGYEMVDKLFEYLPLKDIINQRRVCKLWQQVGLKRLKKDSNQIKISFDPQKSIEKFLEMAKGFSFKFTNFAISYLNDGSNDDANPRIKAFQQTIRLLDEYGIYMKAIALNLCDSTNGWTFLSDVLVNKAPNLERLYLEGYLRRSKATELFSGKSRPELKLKQLILVWQDEPIEPIYSHTLLPDLFASSPCLESLTVSFASEVRIGLTKYTIQILADNGNISNLKKLSFNVGDHDILQILATCFKSAPLEILFIGIYRIDLAMLAYIETFFDDHKDTLKNLNITFPCVKFLNKFPFPTMNNLKVLSIYGWCFDETGLSQHRIPFGMFNFGKLFPNLLTLRLYENPMTEGTRFFNMDEIFPEDTTPLLTLKNLELPPLSNPAVLRRIRNIFPNVLKLNVASQSPAVLRELWTTWPEIKTLNIWIVPYSSYRLINLDSIFTGVAGSNYSRNFPSISHLKKLRHLRIFGGSYPSGIANLKNMKIKDETAHLALAKMKELVSLQISGDRHEISPSCVEHLCTELGMLKKETEAQVRLQLVKYEWQMRSCGSAYLDYE